MELTGIGGGLMVALAAGLWLAYLVPNWFKRREYLATERNAVRLQQTIRVLAETAEVPAEVQAEAAARRLAQAQRPEFRQGPVAVGRRPSVPAPDPRETIRRRRRSRAIASLVLLAALVTGVVQVSLIATTGAVGASWVVLGVAGLGVFASLGVLVRLAEVSRAARRPVAARPARRTSLGAQQLAQRQQQPAAWTPVPVPRPLYLSRTDAPAARATVDPQFELELAAASAERALRAAEREVPAMPVAPAASAPASRFASMGIVDDASPVAPDIDAVLARRRAAG